MNLINLLIFKGSRKVGFGLWIYITASVFLVKHFIESEQWFTVVGLASALIGGGTWVDKKYELDNRKLDSISAQPK